MQFPSGSRRLVTGVVMYNRYECRLGLLACLATTADIDHQQTTRSLASSLRFKASAVTDMLDANLLEAHADK